MVLHLQLDLDLEAELGWGWTEDDAMVCFFALQNFIYGEKQDPNSEAGAEAKGKANDVV